MRDALVLVTSGTQPLAEVLSIVEAAARGGIDYLLIREKTRTARELCEWIETLAAVISRERILVNDRLDVAAACGCRGGHLAYHSLTPAQARRVLGTGRWIGRSVHSFAEAEAAWREGADYLLYGHIYASHSKPGLLPRGTAELAKIVSRLPIPVLAIGGIRPEHVPEVMATGCAGVAVLSGITAAPDPEAAARVYRLRLDEARKRAMEEGGDNHPQERKGG